METDVEARSKEEIGIDFQQLLEQVILNPKKLNIERLSIMGI